MLNIAFKVVIDLINKKQSWLSNFSIYIHKLFPLKQLTNRQLTYSFPVGTNSAIPILLAFDSHNLTQKLSFVFLRHATIC